MIGEHPLDVVVPVLQEGVVHELGVERVDAPRPILLARVESVIGEAPLDRFTGILLLLCTPKFSIR